MLWLAFYYPISIQGDFTMSLIEQDIIQGFLFQGLAIRGILVRLHASYQAALTKHHYPSAAQGLLADALCVAALLSHTTKIKGTISLQAQGTYPISLLLAECNHQYHLRGLVKHADKVLPGNLAELFGAGKMAITMKMDDKEVKQNYQGVVPLVGEDLAQAIEGYFIQSEQIPTKVYLAHDGNTAAGLLLQVLPSDLPTAPDDWQHITTLSNTLTDEELLSLSNADILRRLYHQESIHLFDTQPLTFRCSCSRARMESMLLSLGEASLKSILAEQGAIDTHCEFCNHHYVFDAVDTHQLLADPTCHTFSNKEH